MNNYELIGVALTRALHGLASEQQLSDAINAFSKLEKESAEPIGFQSRRKGASDWDGVITHRPPDSYELRECEIRNVYTTPPPAKPAPGMPDSFQSRVQPWMMETFGAEISSDMLERSDRFTEESLELGQSLGHSKERAHALVEYVYSRPVGEPSQEVGGVMVTLAALCLAANMDMHAAAEAELARVWTKIDVIREKQKSKPRGSALPQAAGESK